MKPGFFLPALLLLALPAISMMAAAQVDEATMLAYSKNWDKAVFIVLYNTQYGTGWWVNQEGYAVTAAHVVGYSSGVAAQGIKGELKFSCNVIDVNNEYDLALLKCNHQPEVYLPIDIDYEKGDEVITLGYPMELLQLTGSLELASTQPRASFGEIAWIHPSKPWLVEVTSVTDAGNSGGPVIDVASGGVVGVVSFALTGKAATLYYATGSLALKDFLDENNIQYEEAGAPAAAIAAGAAAAGAPGLALALGAGALAVAIAAIYVVTRRG